MRCPRRETKARTNGDASGPDRTNGNEIGLDWTGRYWNGRLMIVIAQQIVEKKGNNHDFARTG